MRFNFKILFKTIVEAVSSDGALSDRMCSVIDECAKQIPHPDWDQFRKLDFDSDRYKFNNWIENTFSTGEERPLRKGLWFGISNPVIEGIPTADVYVSAAPEFDKDSIDWASDVDYPETTNHLRSLILFEMYCIAYDSEQGLKNEAEYPLTLAYAAMVAKEVLATSKLSQLIPSLQGAACGFDSGDLLFIGKFVDGKFIPDVRAG